MSDAIHRPKPIKASVVPTGTVKTVHLYVCPTPACSNYYGSSGTLIDLGAEFTGPAPDDRAKQLKDTGSPFRHSRAACPDCRARGVKVERTFLKTMVIVPVEATPTPALPKSLRDHPPRDRAPDLMTSLQESLRTTKGKHSRCGTPDCCGGCSTA